MKLAQEARVIAFALFPASRELVLRLSVKSEEWKIGGCHRLIGQEGFWQAKMFIAVSE